MKDHESSGATAARAERDTMPSKRETYQAWKRFHQWMREGHPTAHRIEKIISILLTKQDLAESSRTIQKNVWANDHANLDNIDKLTVDSYRHSLSALRRYVKEFNSANHDSGIRLEVASEGQSKIVLRAHQTLPISDEQLLPLALFPGTVVMSRLAEQPITSQRQATTILEFLTEEVPGADLEERSDLTLVEWRGEKLVRRGMGEQVARLLDHLWPHLPESGVARPRAAVLQAHALDAVGMSRIVHDAMPDGPPLDTPLDPIRFRAAKARLRAHCHAASRIEDMAPQLQRAIDLLRQEGFADEARQMLAWLLHRRVSEAYESVNRSQLMRWLAALEEEGAAVDPADRRTGALGLRCALKAARMHANAGAEALLDQIQALEQACLSAGHALLATRLESYRVHLLWRLGAQAKARPLSRRNVATRIFLMDRSGLQFALRDLAAIESGAEEADIAFADELRHLAAGLAHLTSDHAARVASGFSADNNTPNGRIPQLAAWLPLVTAGHLEELLTPPEGFACRGLAL